MGPWQAAGEARRGWTGMECTTGWQNVQADGQTQRDCIVGQGVL